MQVGQLDMDMPDEDAQQLAQCTDIAMKTLFTNLELLNNKQIEDKDCTTAIARIIASQLMQAYYLGAIRANVSSKSVMVDKPTIIDPRIK